MREVKCCALIAANIFLNNGNDVHVAVCACTNLAMYSLFKQYKVVQDN